MSTKLITFSCTLAIVGLLAGCSGANDQDVDAIVEASPAPTETMEAAPEPDGTRAIPWPTGTPAKYSTDSVWTFTFGLTAVDQYAAIAAFNEFADAPGEGSMYITAPVTISIEDNEQTASGADPWASLSVTYVTSSGNTAEECLSELPGPGDLYAVGTMYGGATAEFLACAIVAADEVSGGTWAVRSLIEPDLVSFVFGAE
jgi:hypothetical protein